MSPVFLLVLILFPLLTGAGLCLLRTREHRTLSILTMIVTSVTSVFAWVILLIGIDGPLEAIHFAPELMLLLKLDGMGRFFLGLIATLWPITVLYAHSYMKDEEHLRLFYGFFTMTYSATLGVALSGNLFSMYCFYEMLTLTTVPLVLHPMTREAVRASREYFIISLGGAAFSFAAMVYLLSCGVSGPFRMGGYSSGHPYGEDVTLLFWLFGFIGFAVKTAVFPLHHWLPRASVAPTPVTALLHAVAVVKSGAFAMIRLTYYCFGADVLRGTWAQTAAIALTSFTIIYGSSIAVREGHWKRRLAYSTVANLSYVAFGAMLMTPAGLVASLLHMAAHACIKILAFFCAGAVLRRTGRALVAELDGMGRRMPVTFVCFTFSAFALMGLPPFSGFISKWYLLTAAAELGGIGYIGAAALLISALLTAVYMLTVVRRAWFPDRGADLTALEQVREADAAMLVPLVILAAGTLVLGIFPGPVLAAAEAIAGGL